MKALVVWVLLTNIPLPNYEYGWASASVFYTEQACEKARADLQADADSINLKWGSRCSPAKVYR